MAKEKATKKAEKTAKVAAPKKAVAKATKGTKAKVERMLKVAAWRQQQEQSGRRFVFFRLAEAVGVTDEDLAKVQVSLSRIPGNCIFGINKMYQHDYHAPPFFDGGEGEAGDTENPYNKFGGEKSANAYMDRVFGDIGKAVGELLPGVKVTFEGTEWTDDAPPQPPHDDSDSEPSDPD